MYYDKTQIILRDTLVKYVTDIEDVEKQLEEFLELFLMLKKLIDGRNGGTKD